MKIEFHATPQNDLAVSLQGEFDALACKQIRPEFELVANDSNRKNVILDLSQVTFLDSSGIGAIVFLFKRLRVQGYELTLSNVQGQPKELITLLRIDSAISVIDTTEQEALQGEG